MLTLRTTLAMCIAIAGALPATAQEWKSGFGQGSTEAWIELGPGNEIYISCTGGFGRPITGIWFTLAGEEPPPNSIVTVIVDGADPLEVPMDDHGALSSNSRVDAAWFELVRDALRSGSSAYIRFPDGKGARFPLTGSAEAIGDCPADFWRTDLEPL